MMQYVMLVFMFGVVNLCLGYGLAVHQNHLPAPWARNWNVWSLLGRGKSTRQFPTTSVGRNSPPEPLIRLVKPSESRAATPHPGLTNLQRLVDSVTESLTAFAKRLEDPSGGQFNSTAWTFVGELQEICAPYMRRLSGASEQILSDAEEQGGGSPADDALQDILLEQEAQLETTLSNLQHMDFDSGLSAAIQRVLSETNKNLVTAHKLKQAVQEVSATKE